MKIVFKLEAETDRESLLLRLRDIARVVEIGAIRYDAFDEGGFATSLVRSGFPPEKLIEERLTGKWHDKDGQPIEVEAATWPTVAN